MRDMNGVVVQPGDRIARRSSSNDRMTAAVEGICECGCVCYVTYTSDLRGCLMLASGKLSKKMVEKNWEVVR